MAKVRCISPHGGAHNGLRHDGTPVHRLPNGELPDVKPEDLRLPPNEGGYVEVPSLGRHVGYGEVIDVPDDWPINEAHFEWVEPPVPKRAKSAPAAPAEGK